MRAMIYFVIILMSFFLIPNTYADPIDTSVAYSADDPAGPLRGSLIFSNLQPKSNQSPLEHLKNKISELGYKLDSFPPEGEPGFVSEGTLLDTIIQNNTHALLMNKEIIDAINRNTNMSTDTRNMLLGIYKRESEYLSKGLAEVKSQYSAKFKDNIENRMEFPTDIKCKFPGDGNQGFSCDMKNHKTMNEIKASGISKNSAFAKAFSKGPLKDFIEQKTFKDGDGTESNEPSDSPDELASASEVPPPKTERECTIRSLDIYRKKIETISEGSYAAFGAENTVSKKERCRLIRLSYNIENSPFKRRLIDGAFFDAKGNVITLDQKAFDEILQSWNVLNGAKSTQKNQVQRGKSQGRKGHIKGRK